MSRLKLTPQQQAVVDHNSGPALVFAVAGAGKTTALEHRIARLVGERVFDPERILAAAYNKDVQLELTRRLKLHPGCDSVPVVTLHAFALSAIRMAKEQGLLRNLSKDAFSRFETAGNDVLSAALRAARSQSIPYKSDLDALDQTDFLTWVAAAKGNLQYPELNAVSERIRATKLAGQAVKPSANPWYLDLYRVFEIERRRLGLLTFDDQLLSGWEIVVTHESILHSLQGKYDCVLVDEYQDVNLAQADILDRLVEPHRNFMVIGDDDQTIYEWRGARPEFILGFQKKYGAKRYYMTENFRCKAGPVLLANHVIRHNKMRTEKSLQLTQGLDGETVIQACADASQMGAAIADTVAKKLRSGFKLRDIAILVRAYAQTAPVEQGLIKKDIPYEIVNNDPFYLRREVQVFVDYCRLAFLDKQSQTRNEMTSGQREQMGQLWRKIYWQPKRYITRELSDLILEQVFTQQSPLVRVLKQKELSDNGRVLERLSELAGILEWLSDALPPGGQARQSAASVLAELDRRLGYTKYLEERSAISETGADEAETVRQFIEYARSRGNLQEFLTYVNQLEDERRTDRKGTRGDVVTIRSIHTAKGLEWPVVVIPSCNDGNIPHRKSANPEEERRLLYVALTRSKQDLHIYHLGSEVSPFLEECGASGLLRDLNTVLPVFSKDPNTWTINELKMVALRAPRLGLVSYLTNWSTWPPERISLVVRSVLGLFQSAKAHGVRLGSATDGQAVAAWRQLSDHAMHLDSSVMPSLQQWLKEVGVPPSKPVVSAVSTPVPRANSESNLAGSARKPEASALPKDAHRAHGEYRAEASTPAKREQRIDGRASTTEPATVKRRSPTDGQSPTATQRLDSYVAGTRVFHVRFGEGVVKKMTTVGGRPWVQIVFPHDLYQIEISDPELLGRIV